MNTDPQRFLKEQEEALRVIHVEFRTDVSDIAETLDMWFGGPKWRKSGHRLDLLGKDWSGGMFCVWRYPDLHGREPPVVFMGFEGEGLSVVATNTLAFVELLSTGKIWGVEPGVFTDDDEQPPEHAEFRRQACQRFGFLPRTAEEIRAEALAAHPDFEAWVNTVTQ